MAGRGLGAVDGLAADVVEFVGTAGCLREFGGGRAEELGAAACSLLCRIWNRWESRVVIYPVYFIYALISFSQIMKKIPSL